MTAAVLVAWTAALGFSQSVSATRSGHSPESGVLVISVLSGSPADKAGLERGDVILDINGSVMNSPSNLREAILSHKKGDMISLRVIHDDAQKTLSIHLREIDGHPYLGTRLLPDERNRVSILAELEQR
jgi:S1-C subfamily serine protease